MFLPGAFLLLARRWSVGLAVVLAVTAAEILLTNLKQFQARYYLFLGAADGRCRRPHVLACSSRKWALRWRCPRDRLPDLRRGDRPRLRQDLRKRWSAATPSWCATLGRDRGRRGRRRAQAAPRVLHPSEERSPAGSRRPGQAPRPPAAAGSVSPWPTCCTARSSSSCGRSSRRWWTAAGAPDWLEVVLEAPRPESGSCTATGRRRSIEARIRPRREVTRAGLAAWLTIGGWSVLAPSRWLRSVRAALCSGIDEGARAPGPAIASSGSD